MSSLSNFLTTPDKYTIVRDELLRLFTQGYGTVPFSREEAIGLDLEENEAIDAPTILLFKARVVTAIGQYNELQADPNLHVVTSQDIIYVACVNNVFYCIFNYYLLSDLLAKVNNPQALTIRTAS